MLTHSFTLFTGTSFATTILALSFPGVKRRRTWIANGSPDGAAVTTWHRNMTFFLLLMLPCCLPDCAAFGIRWWWFVESAWLCVLRNPQERFAPEANTCTRSQSIHLLDTTELEPRSSKTRTLLSGRHAANHHLSSVRFAAAVVLVFFLLSFFCTIGTL